MFLAQNWRKSKSWKLDEMYTSKYREIYAEQPSKFNENRNAPYENFSVIWSEYGDLLIA